MTKIESLTDTTRLAPPLQRALEANARYGGHMGSFMRLHLDPALLVQYESPGFNESSAIAMDDVAMTQDASLLPRIELEQTQAASALVPAAIVLTPGAHASVGWTLTTKHSPKSDLLCRYRKGKCSNPRTLKRNGSLHSYCEFHRQRSILNQRKFDKKKREAMDKHVCHGCKEGGVCHDQAHAARRVSSQQAIHCVAAYSMLDEKRDVTSKIDQSRSGEECAVVML